ncbi:MAG: ATP-grasp domain-containing protein [Candidatus Hodarchaeota archaeon]
MIRIILTSMGGLVTPSMIKSLRDYFNDIYIVGLNATEGAIGFHFADKSYIVPPGNAKNYAEEVTKIAVKEKIDFIIPLSDEETLALSKIKNKLLEKNIKVLCSDHVTCQTAFHKDKMLEFLKDNGVDVPKFRVPKNCDELMKYAKELGYPEKKVVLKPTFSRGARGFWLMDEEYDEVYGLMKDRNRQTIKLGRVIEILSNCQEFPSLIMMDYLEGDDFNVDVLARNGESLHIIPDKRLFPKAGPVSVGQVLKDEKINELVRKIVKIFKFDYYLNIEVAYDLNKNKPMIYEINARVGAPIVINAAAGINLLAKGLEMAMGIEVGSNVKIQKTKMIRYWNEFFEYEDEFFST